MKKENKELTAVQIIEAIKALESKMEKPPWLLSCLVGKGHSKLEVWGDQVSLGEDFLSLEDAREAVSYLVRQLGGNVKWG